MSVRVLRVYHSAVVAEYRQRDRMLRSRHGYDVHLVCPPAWSEGGSLVPAERDDDLPLHVVRARGRRHPILFWYETRGFRRVLRDVRPQIVDLHEEPYSLAVAAALRVVSRVVPDARVCLYTAQNILKRYPPPFRQLERRALRRAAAAYPCSTEAGEVLRAKGFAGPLHVLSLGVSLEPERPPSRRAPLRVGMLGRLEPYKGGHIALRAFAKATPDLDAVLEFVGSGSQEEELRSLAVELAVEARVLFPGPVSQSEALDRIRGYDVVVMPSLTTPAWKEQFGRVAAQAMAAGTPVIASDSGSLREVLGDSGELAREGDVDDFAQKLRRLLDDPERRRALAARGRRRAEEHHSWERVADGVDQMYRTVLGSS